jgi:hypothetical protein
MEMIETFPDDENGDVLRQMQESGDDLSRPREIDFSVVFPGELEARTMATQFRELGFAVKTKKADVVPNLPWDVLITRYMVPSHDAITALEHDLQVAAEPLGGRNDGWGCFERTSHDH